MRRGLSRTILVGAVVGSAVGALGVPAPTAAGAAGPTGWAVWSPLSGGANAYATTMHYLVDGLDAGAYVVEPSAPSSRLFNLVRSASVAHIEAMSFSTRSSTLR